MEELKALKAQMQTGQTAQQSAEDAAKTEEVSTEDEK